MCIKETVWYINQVLYYNNKEQILKANKGEEWKIKENRVQAL